MKDAEVTTLNFEHALNQLETIIEKMGKGEFNLEIALEQFQQGIALARKCQADLKMAEQTIEKFTTDEGEYKLIPFSEEE